MAFHINPGTGEPGACRAMVQCPFGGADEHYATAEDARAAYEAEKPVLAKPLRRMPKKYAQDLTDLEQAKLDALTDTEFKTYKDLLENDYTHGAAIRRIESLRESGSSAFQSPSAAARQVKKRVASFAKPLTVPHDKPEDSKTASGNSFSKVTDQPDGRLAQSINGVLIVIHPKDKREQQRVTSETGETLGWLRYNGEKKKWDVQYADGNEGRSHKFPVDANTALIKKAGLGPKAVVGDKPKMPARGYNPEHSELDRYRDFPNNKARTIGRLRQLNSEDLAAMFNQLELSIHNGHYSDEIQSDLAAQKRVRSVLAERGESVAVVQHGRLEPGQDYGSVNTYGLEK